MTRAVNITSKQLCAIVLSPDTGEDGLGFGSVPISESAPVNVDDPDGGDEGVDVRFRGPEKTRFTTDSGMFTETAYTSFRVGPVLEL